MEFAALHNEHAVKRKTAVQDCVQQYQTVKVPNAVLLSKRLGAVLRILLKQILQTLVYRDVVHRGFRLFVVRASAQPFRAGAAAVASEAEECVGIAARNE